jgi:hypothetical protein
MRGAGWTVSAASRASIALGVFLVSLCAYLSNDALLPMLDATPSAYLPASALEDGELAVGPLQAPNLFVWDLDTPAGRSRVAIRRWTDMPAGLSADFAEQFRTGRLHFAGPHYYLVPTLRQRPATGEPLFASIFGPAAGVVAIPIAAAARVLGVNLRDELALWTLAKLTASLLVAGSAALVFLTAARFLSPDRALLLSAAYALGTCVWSISSQALFQQTPALFFISLGAFLIICGSEPWLRGAAAGLAFAAAAACRPTCVLVVVAAAAFLLAEDRRTLAAFIVGALPIGFGLIAYNLYYFDTPLSFGQLDVSPRFAEFKTGSPALWQTPLWLGAAGLLSPSRGLLIYSPFLAAAFAGALFAWKDARYRRLRFVAAATLALWLPAFVWFDWWGGWTYGYRPIVDSTPLLALLCIPVLDEVLARRAWRLAFSLALAWSLIVQLAGAFLYTPWGWNARLLDANGTRADVDRPLYRHRLWSFSDWQILYFLANADVARADRAVGMARSWTAVSYYIMQRR